MSDDSSLTPEAMQAKLTELEGKLTQTVSDLEFQKSEARKAFEKRDEFKQKLETIERETLEKGNEFKPLYEQELNEKTTLKSQLEEVLPYKDKWNTYEATRKEFLLGKVADEDLKKVYQKYDLVDLELVVAKLETKPVPTDGSRGGGGSFNYDGKKWDEISSADKEKLAKDQPELYKKIYYEKYRKQPVL